MEKLNKVFEKLDEYYYKVHNDDISKNNAATMLKYLLSKEEKFNLLSPYETITSYDWDEDTGNLAFGIVYHQDGVTYERDGIKEPRCVGAIRRKILSNENKTIDGIFSTVENDEFLYL